MDGLEQSPPALPVELDALQATTTRHRIRVEAAVPRVLIAGDAGRLDRVIANLLSNAIKYSPRGGAITVTVSYEEREDKAGDFAVVEVTDQGLGIPAADLPHIFDQFRRAANVTGRILGTGIVWRTACRSFASMVRRSQ